MGEQGDKRREPDRPAPYQGVFGQGDERREPDRPGPYRGVFGQGAESTREVRERGAYSGAWAGIGDRAPKQVVMASAIAFGLAGLCVLLGLMMATSAGDQIAELLTGSPDARLTVIVVIAVCAVAYLVPAIFLRKRKPWARWILIAVASFGIAGGITALPNSILGLAIHATLLVLLVQQPTRLWFQHR